MKYFLDTEFHEYKKKPLFSKGINTIELISIGIVAEDGREYYAISKDFDIKKAWDNEWLRQNVLNSIWKDLIKNQSISNRDFRFNYKSLKTIIKKYAKTNKEIAEEVCQFIDARYIDNEDHSKGFMYPIGTSIKEVKTVNVEFYGYYSDYDWVVFCWLFGRMIDLPKGFPMYCIDLKQILDEKAISFEPLINSNIINIEEKIAFIKNALDYPKQINEHNALADAKWNHELYKFLSIV